MKVSLIISTYNRPDALKLCLDSVTRQTHMPDEVIVADDGSRPDTAELVKSMAEGFPCPLIHVWHEDTGFRLAAIRNKAIAAAKGDYIVQTDGDMVLHPEFVADHVRLARPGIFLKGRRVYLSEKFTEKVCASGRWQSPSMFGGDIESHRANAVHIPLVGRYLMDHYRLDRVNLLGANMSYFKRDFYAINGYDEGFVGWGHEDMDFGCRLTNNGVKGRFLKFTAVCFHLYHPIASRESDVEQRRRALDRYRHGVTWIENGVDKYLKS